MEAKFKELLPVNGCAHVNVIWDILKATTRAVRAKVKCNDCRCSWTGTVKIS